MAARTFAWLAVAATLLALTGCGGPGDPAPEPPATTTTATPDPGPTPPTLPPEATQDGREGAIAFVKHYIDLLNYAQATGDVTGLRDESSTTCSSCTTTITRLSELYDGGGRLTGGDFSHIDHIASQDEATQDWLIVTRAEFTPQVVEHPDGSRENLNGGETTYEFSVTFDDNRWQVRRWSRLR